MGRIAVLLLLAAVSTGFVGCVSEEERNDPSRVSNIPWNRPETWESQGPLGGMMNQPSR